MVKDIKYLAYNAQTEETLKLEMELELMAQANEVDFTSFGTVKDGFEDNEAEFYCIPHCYDSNKVYDFKDEIDTFFEHYEPICAYKSEIIEAEDLEDYDILNVSWEYK